VSRTGTASTARCDHVASANAASLRAFATNSNTFVASLKLDITQRLRRATPRANCHILDDREI
jgi:hypothetical protein